jgi:lysozyme
VIDSIIDTYHGNSINLGAIKKSGVVAIIHKASQGTRLRDPAYAKRRDAAKAAGFLWGAYHFSTGDDVVDQAHNFLEAAAPGDDDLIALDWEPSDGPVMTLQQARDFVQVLRNETGRWPVIYGGHLLRESVGHLQDPTLSNCPLWYARYASLPVGIPTQIWATYTLWQYTDGVDGSKPRSTPGCSGADRNRFNGSTDELREAWPFIAR